MKRKRIVIFTLDCLYSHAAVSILIKKYHNDIALVCFSDRYGPKYGSFFHQLVKYFKRGGFRFVVYMAYFFLFYDFFSVCQYWFLGRKAPMARLDKLCKEYKVKILKTKDVNCLNVEEVLKELNPDIGISAYFDQIIKPNILSIPLYGMFNIHPGILPDYRGPFPTIYTAIAQSSFCGSTIHIMNEKLDEGDIISIQKVPFLKNNSIMFYEWKVMRLGGNKMVEILEEINRNISYSLYPQERGAYKGYPKKNDINKMYSLGYKLYSFKDFLKILKS